MVYATHQHKSAISIHEPLPTSPLQVVIEHWLGFLASYIKLPLAIYFNMVMYMFQYYSLKSSHPKVDVQKLSCVQLFATPGTAGCQASLSFTKIFNRSRLFPISAPYLLVSQRDTHSKNWPCHLLALWPWTRCPSHWDSICLAFSKDSRNCSPPPLSFVPLFLY